jgi:hypothetical protein
MTTRITQLFVVVTAKEVEHAAPQYAFPGSYASAAVITVPSLALLQWLELFLRISIRLEVQVLDLAGDGGGHDTNSPNRPTLWYQVDSHAATTHVRLTS